MYAVYPISRPVDDANRANPVRTRYWPYIVIISYLRRGEQKSVFLTVSVFVFLDRRYVEHHHRPAPTVITTRTAITSNVHGTSSVSTNKSTTTSSSTKISDTVSEVKSKTQLPYELLHRDVVT